MASISIPPINVLAVDTTLTAKTIVIPPASTMCGTSLIIKDNFGNSLYRAITLTTHGLDRFETGISSIFLSSNYGSWTFTNDGISNWLMTDLYTNTLPFHTERFALVEASNMISHLEAQDFPATAPFWVDRISGVGNWTVNNASYNSGLRALTMSNGYVEHSAAISGFSNTVFSIIVIYNRLGDSLTPYTSDYGQYGAVMFQISRDLYTANHETVVFETGVYDYDSDAALATPGINLNAINNVNVTIGKYFFGYVKNGATGTLYLNGSYNGLNTGDGTATINNFSFGIGKDLRNEYYSEPAGHLNGEIAFFGMWNTALTAMDMANFYSSNVSRF